MDDTYVQKMAKIINEPYEEDGRTITPNDKPSDFKPGTIAVFEAHKIKVNWKEEIKSAEDSVSKPTPEDKKKKP